MTSNSGENRSTHLHSIGQHLRLFFATAALLFAGASTLSGDANVTDAWRAWRYSCAIAGASSSAPARIDIPFDLYSHAEANLSDIRIIDDTGAETPYVVYGPQSRPPVESRSATLGER